MKFFETVILWNLQQRKNGKTLKKKNTHHFASLLCFFLHNFSWEFFEKEKSVTVRSNVSTFSQVEGRFKELINFIKVDEASLIIFYSIQRHWSSWHLMDVIYTYLCASPMKRSVANPKDDIGTWTGCWERSALSRYFHSRYLRYNSANIRLMTVTRCWEIPLAKLFDVTLEPRKNPCNYYHSRL